MEITGVAQPEAGSSCITLLHAGHNLLARRRGPLHRRALNSGPAKRVPRPSRVTFGRVSVIHILPAGRLHTLPSYRFRQFSIGYIFIRSPEAFDDEKNDVVRRNPNRYWAPRNPLTEVLYPRAYRPAAGRGEKRSGAFPPAAMQIDL